MTLTQLRYFLAIATAGTMSAAARQVGIAQPALSLQIAHLEAELGQKLFARHGRGMSLTEMGRRLQSRATEILRHVELAKEELADDTESPSGTVSIGMATAANMAFSVDLLISVRRRFPRLKVQLVESMSGFLLEWVERGRIDMAIVYDVPPHGSLLIERLATEELFLIGSPEAELGSSVPFPELAGIPLIIPGKQHRLGQLIHRLAVAEKLALNIAAEVDSTYTIKKLVTHNEGYTILSWHAVQEEVERGELRAMSLRNPTPRRSIDLVINPLRKLDPSVVAVRKSLVRLVRARMKADASAERSCLV